MYKIQSCVNVDGCSFCSDPQTYDSVDIVFEDENGFSWICECGKWESESAQQKAKLICDLLNSTLENNC